MKEAGSDVDVMTSQPVKDAKRRLIVVVSGSSQAQELHQKPPRLPLVFLPS